MSAHTQRVSGDIALGALRLIIFATFGTLAGVVGHILWKIVAA